MYVSVGDLEVDPRDLQVELKRLKRRFGEAALIAALEALVSKRSRGRIENDDETALLAMRIVIAEKPISDWQAACQIAGAIAGANFNDIVVDSTARRLHGKFEKIVNKNYDRGLMISTFLLRFSEICSRVRATCLDENTTAADLIKEVDSLKDIISEFYLLQEASWLAGVRSKLRAALLSARRD